MKHWLLLYLFCICSFAFAVDSTVSDCNRVALVLDPRLTPDVIEHQWASGEPFSGAPAILELHGCKGEMLDRFPFDKPLAKLDTTLLRGTRVPTYLVTVDLTAPAGTYNGPLTIPVQVINHRLKRAEAIMPDGRSEPINLSLTGKAAWKKVPNGAADDLLLVSCQPRNNGFVTFYRRYHPTRYGWHVRVRSEPTFWESDSAFPEVRFFPGIN